MDVSDSSPADRFANCVELYLKYRPSYPPAIVDFLQEQYHLNADHEIADIGAGVGHSTRLLAPLGCYIYAIEPSQQMFNELVKLGRQFPNFTARLETAEDTNLDAHSIDFIVCGQSFHWFDKLMAKNEFERILKPQGVVILMWNSWKLDTAFGKAYDKLLQQYSTDYTEVSHKTEANEEKIAYLFKSGSYTTTTFANSQYFDLEGLQGRYMSSSYALLPGMDDHDKAMQALEELFNDFQQDGQVEFAYDCVVYHGRLQS